MEKDLKPFKNNEDASLFVVLDKNNDYEIEIYTKPKPSKGELTYMKWYREKQKGHECGKYQNGDDQSCEDGELS